MDLVADPGDGSRPGFAWWPLTRRPQSYPGFGEPVLAPCDGTVVRAHDRERDHLTRTSPAAVAYMFSVEMLREVFGPARILGNHLVIGRGDGTFVTLAHLRRGSVRAHPGQRVAAGERVADCGNSGNSSEPHLHLQVTDHPRPAVAAGLPFRFVSADGEPLPVPPNGECLTVDGR